MLRNIFTTAVLLLTTATLHAQQSDTLSLYFPFNKSALPEAAKEQLDSLIYKDVLYDGQAVQIIGFADYVGGERSNTQLSAGRAKEVEDYLLKSGFSPASITMVIGKGRIDHPGYKSNGGYAPDRRVAVVWTVPAKEVPRDYKPAPIVYSAPTVTADLNTLKPDETMVLKNIYFYPTRHEVRPESLPVLDRLFTTLEENLTLRIGIEGHVCCISSNVADALDMDNNELALSVNRAKFI